jgi:hypothetical protein
MLLTEILLISVIFPEVPLISSEEEYPTFPDGIFKGEEIAGNGTTDYTRRIGLSGSLF